MASEEELFAKLDSWLAGLAAEPNIFEVVQTRDVELFAVYVLRHFRAATKEAVIDRLARDASKLGPPRWERAGAIGMLVSWLSEIWQLSMAEQVGLFGLSDEAELATLKVQVPEDVSHELLERLAMLMDIYQALQTLLPGRGGNSAWLRRPNTARIFSGKSALVVMLERGRLGIRDVRAYLWAEIWSV